MSPGLPDGRYEIDMPDSTLKCTGIKEATRPPAVILYSQIQEDSTLAQRVGQQITRKMTKLHRYKREGYTTVLILETQDQSLMNQHKMLEPVRDATSGTIPDGLDQLWFAEARGATFFDFARPIREATTCSTDAHRTIPG